MAKVYDMLIIGGGPGGYTAAGKTFRRGTDGPYTSDRQLPGF